MPPAKFSPSRRTTARCRTASGPWPDRRRSCRRQPSSARDRRAAVLARLELVQSDDVGLVAVAARGDRAFVERRALLVNKLGSTDVGTTPLLKAWIAACMSFASLAQLDVQQLCDSLRKRTTKREIAGSSRFIFDFAASYASSTASLSLGGPSAKNGCCLSAVSDAWHSEQNCSSTGYTVARTARLGRPGSSCSGRGRAAPAARARSCAPSKPSTRPSS